MRRRTKASAKFFSSKGAHLLYWLSAAGFAFGLFFTLTWRLHVNGDLESFDSRFLIALSKIRRAAWNGPAVDVTALGSPVLLTFFSIFALAILAVLRNWRGFIHLSVASLGSIFWTRAIKELVGRARPTAVSHLVDVTGYSYPSGHSLSAAAIYLSLAIIAAYYWKSFSGRVVLFCVALLLIGAVSFSRAYLGVHYPSDLFSGFFLGSAWALFLGGVFSRHPRID
ncbi:MAG: phosphatase PAP2 family protein [Bdellovibrionota bacterium]